MHDIIRVAPAAIPAMTPGAIGKIRQFETHLRALPQCPLDTDHVLHAGVYTRTVMLPAGVVITGALIKVATILAVSGDCTVSLGDEVIRVTGFHVIAAAAGRKQAFAVHKDTFLSMSFATSARSVEEAEREFTDEADMLLSRVYPDRNTVRITGE